MARHNQLQGDGKLAEQVQNGRSACIFCQSTSNRASEEHIFPEWLKKDFPTLPTSTRLQIEGETDESGAFNRRVSTRTGLARNVRAKGPCVRCNSGWMSNRIEKPVQTLFSGMMRGHPTILNDANQTKLAAWTALKAMALDSRSGRDNLAIPQRDRTFLMQRHCAPLSGWQVWLGRSHVDAGVNAPFINKAHADFHEQDGLAVEDDVADADFRPSNTQATTIVFGQVLLFAVSSQTKLGGQVFLTGPASRVLLQIWPIQHVLIEWPIAPRATLKVIDDLSIILTKFR